MAFLHIFFLAVTLAVVAGDDSCPAATEISPCTCDNEGLNCMSARTLEDIQKAFRAKFKYGGIRSIWIQGTPLTSIPKNLFGTVKTKEFYIEVNDITSVDFNAFLGSNKTLITLSLFGNKIDQLDYSGLRQYEVLNILNLGRNRITSIPDGAFNSQSITEILLVQNRISNIGKNAFSGVPKLNKLQLSYNALQTLGPMSLAMKAHSPTLEIHLTANQISSVSNTAFEGTSPLALYLNNNRLSSLPFNPFGNLTVKIGSKRGGFMVLAGNPFTCKGCDYSWLVLNKNVVYPILRYFMCTDGRDILSLTKSNIECYN